MFKLANFKFRILLISWLVIFSGLNIYWLYLNQAPPQWDQSNYLDGSEYVYQSVNEGFFSFYHAFTTVLPRKAPLIAILPTPFYFLLGDNQDTAMVVNFLALIVFYYSFYQLVKRFFNINLAMLSLAIVSTFPLFYGLLRQFFVEFLLMSITTTWILIAIQTDRLTNRKYLFFLGIVSGIAMMTKFLFFLYVLGPAIIILNSNFKSSKPLVKNIPNLLIVLIPFLIITLPWYSRNILTVLWHAKRFSVPDNLGMYYYGPPLSWNNISLSLLDFISYVISPFNMLILLVLIPILIYSKKKYQINYLLSSWFVIPFLVFFLGPNKDYRFMLPLLPPLAVFIAWLVTDISKKYRYVIIFVVLSLTTFQFLNSVFEIDLIKNKTYSLGQIIFLKSNLDSYVYLPERNIWPNPSILKFLEQLQPSNYKTILLGSEYKYFNVNNLLYLTRKDRLKLKITTASYYTVSTQAQDIQNSLNHSNYIIFKVGGDNGPSDLNKVNSYLINQTSSWKQIPNQFQFPDGGKLIILQNPKNV